MTRSGKFSRRHILQIFASIVFVLSFAIRVTYIGQDYYHPDDPIPVEVLRHLDKFEDFDTNYAKSDLKGGFSHDQYLFSSYLYSLFVFTKSFGALGLSSDGASFPDMTLMRLFSSLLGALSVIPLYLVASRFGSLPAVIALLLYAFDVQLVQDSHYARPESFLVFLMLLCVHLSLTAKNRKWVPAAGFIAGFMAACKITMLPSLAIPICGLFIGHSRTREGEDHKKYLHSIVLIIAIFAAGFLVGCPYAAIAPDSYINGVMMLRNQYDSGHPPHSLLGSSSVWPMLARYFIAKNGVAIVLIFLYGTYVALKFRKAALAAMAIFSIAYLVYFSGQSVFFERNLSYVLPLVFVVSGYGAARLTVRMSRKYRLAALAILILLLLYRNIDLSSRLIFDELSGRSSKRAEAIERQLKTEFPGMPMVSGVLLGRGELRLADDFFRRHGPFIFCVHSYNDSFSAKYLDEFKARYRTETILVDEGSFGDFPTCTLHTYHSPIRTYLLVVGENADLVPRP